MLVADRRTQILDIISSRKSVTVKEIADIYGVSTETVRRDFEELSSQGSITKTFGGAVLKQKVETSVPASDKLNVMVENKRAMARIACQYISPHDSIFLDHSASVYYLCDYIKEMPLTVFTNSILVIQSLQNYKNINLVTTGGVYNHSELGFFGAHAVDDVNSHNVDKAFLSCQYLDLRRGLSDSREEISNMRRHIISSAVDSSYLIADYTKFDNSSFVVTSPLSALTNLITDRELSPQWADALNRAHVKYDIAQVI